MANMQPLRREDHPELEELWRLYDESMSFVPNSLFTMARRPEILEAFSELITRIWRTGNFSYDDRLEPEMAPRTQDSESGSSQS